MVKYRLIPVILLREGIVVQSKGFKRYQPLGNPLTIVERLSDWASDELIYLDISRGSSYDLGRDDLNNPHCASLLDILGAVSKKCFVPLTFGGRIRSLADVADRISTGADKVAINTRALEYPDFINQCATEFGSQCIVVSIDVRKTGEKEWSVFKDGGREDTEKKVVDWALDAEKRGAGELLINSIDRDGSGAGYDIPLIQSVAQAVDIPVIACGGVGEWTHFAQGCEQTSAWGFAAANIFNYSENSVYKAKQFLYKAGYPFRKPELGYELIDGR